MFSPRLFLLSILLRKEVQTMAVVYAMLIIKDQRPRILIVRPGVHDRRRSRTNGFRRPGLCPRLSPGGGR